MNTGTPLSVAGLALSSHDNQVDHADDRRREDLGPPDGVEERRELRATDSLKMACPFCGASSSGVRRSRGAKVADQVRRTRRCAECGEDFPTKEEVDYECLQQRLADRARLRTARSSQQPPATPNRDAA